MRYIFVLLCFLITFGLCKETHNNDINLTKINQNNQLNTIQVYDPLYKYNQAMSSVNEILYGYFIRPVSKGYNVIVPNNIKMVVSNFFTNILYPVRLVNNLLQGKFENSWDETKRFLINTTLGFLGFSDAATLYYNIPAHPEDFGQTLGYWGVGSGPYIVWPILGSSNLRDSVGFIGDIFLQPAYYMVNQDDSIKIYAVKTINEFSKDPDKLLRLKKSGVDMYPYLRDSYTKMREKQIKE